MSDSDELGEINPSLLLLSRFLQMNRKKPPIIKIYEALWCIADKRIEVQKSAPNLFWNETEIIKAKVFSSSWWKFYEVEFDQLKNQIMSNDNGSYWQEYLWYPSIALLIVQWKISVINDFIEWLKWIMRKDINTKNKNDFEKTINEVDLFLVQKWIDIDNFKQVISMIEREIEKMNLSMLWKKRLPPKWY